MKPRDFTADQGSDFKTRLLPTEPRVARWPLRGQVWAVTK